MSESRITRMTQMKGGLGWQVGRRRVADTDTVAGAQDAGWIGRWGGESASINVVSGAEDVGEQVVRSV